MDSIPIDVLQDEDIYALEMEMPPPPRRPMLTPRMGLVSMAKLALLLMAGACSIDATGTEGLFAGDSLLTTVAGPQCDNRHQL
jgi:hypothetical protein